MRIRNSKTDSVDFMFNFNYTASYKLEWDLNLPVHGEERVFIFGGPFAMFEDFSDQDRNVSKLMMSQIGEFVKNQVVSWSEVRFSKLFRGWPISETVDHEE